jgi:NAD(P)-dependent dehydrogenase (short-subunit alcohol dehydrogenase family)
LTNLDSGAVYTASKHGLVGLTKNTAAFYATKGIRCNAICPGGMATNIADVFAAGGMSQEGYAVAAKYINMDLIVPAEELHHMGNLAVYLCSDSSKLVNGSIVIADQGDLAAA